MSGLRHCDTHGPIVTDDDDGICNAAERCRIYDERMTRKMDQVTAGTGIIGMRHR